MKGKTLEIIYRIVALVFVVAAIGVLGTVAADRFALKNWDDVTALLAGPCERPIVYSIGTFDERFSITRTTLESAMSEAAGLWNAAAGKTVLVYGEGGVPVNLLYGEHQKAAELGKTIDSEQQRYEDKRAEVEEMRSTYLALVSRYNTRLAAFERDTEAYDKDVAYWNARGGAPPAEYQRLQSERSELERRERELGRLSDEVNAFVDELNAEVEELNSLAEVTNTKVNEYNENVGHDFDQGNYIQDKEGKRINIFEFTNSVELKRLLAHEFGHALSLDHVENPESIMYSYNIGDAFKLTAEDTAALRTRCGIE